MKKIIYLLLVIISRKKEDALQGTLIKDQNGEVFSNKANTTRVSGTTQTKPGHVVVVILENKGYSQIIGNLQAPFINSLVKRGTLMTNYYGITHPSYPNYIALFSGSTQGVTNDNCIDGQPSQSNTLYNNLKAVGASFRWHSEGLPSKGSTVCKSGFYVEKHNASTIFKNTPGYTSTTTVNYPFTYSWWTDTLNLAKLQSVNFITPNMQNDMHDGTIAKSDAWLRTHLSLYADWCQRHNSILIVTFDEDNRKYGNHIPTIFVGQHVQANLQVKTTYNHYSLGKTILGLFGANTNLNNFNSAILMTGFWK